MKEFTITFYRTGHPGDESFGTVELPATWNEFQDAKEKARITNNHVAYTFEVSEITRHCLINHIPEQANPLELNLLAKRLNEMSAQESKIFEGMIAIDAQQRKGEPIPLPRLINLTHNTDNCHVAYGVLNSTALGRWLYDNDMLSDEDYERATFKESESRYADEYFAILGRRHCEAEGGVFTSVGYIEIESIDDVYKAGQSISVERSDAPVVLEISKGFFNDPDYDNDLTTTLYLPATVRDINAAIDKVGAASIEECAYHCADCLIPQAKEMIDDTENLDAVNQFAETLAGLARRTRSTVYKAVWEAVKPPNLESAAALVSEIDQCNLNSNMGCPEDYAKEYLIRLKPDAEIAKHINLYPLGKELMQRDIYALGGTLPLPVELDEGADYKLPDAKVAVNPENNRLSTPRKIMAAVFALIIMAAIALIAMDFDGFKAFISGGDLAISAVADAAAVWKYAGLMLMLAVGAVGMVMPLTHKKENYTAPKIASQSRRLSTRTVAAAISILLLIPLTIYIGTYYFGDRRYYFVSMLIILETMLPFAFVFEGRKPQARELVILAVLCAVAVAGRAAFFMLPQFKPVIAVVIIAGVAFGGEAGFIVGALTAFVSNMFFGQGPWTPWQMFAFGIIGFLAGVLFRKGILRRNRAALCIFGGLATFVIYGLIMNTYTLFVYQQIFSWPMFWASILQGIPFDLVHAAATVTFLFIISDAMLDKLDRIKNKYGLIEPTPEVLEIPAKYLTEDV